MVQKELQTCVQDVDKTKKFYFDEEHSAHDVRDKAKDIEEKYVKNIHDIVDPINNNYHFSTSNFFFFFVHTNFQAQKKEGIVLPVNNIIAKK